MRFNFSRITPVVFTLALAPHQTTDAQVYTCVDAEGTTVFSDRPCGTDAEKIEHPVVPLIGTRSVIAVPQSEPAPVVRSPPRQRAAQSDSARDGEYRCSVKRKRLEDLNARLRRGYSRSEGESLRRQRESVELYLETYCR